MLEKIRESSRSIGAYIIIGAIIVVFVAFFGSGSAGFTDLGGGPPSYAAKVNGKEIPLLDFQRAYNRAVNRMVQQSGGQFDARMAEQMGMRENVLDQLVERRLLLQAARENGLAVSNDEVAKEVRQVPDFQIEGHFDFETYKRVLGFNGLTPEAFERDVREGLLLQKFVAQMRQSAKATDAEIREAYEKDNDQASLTVVRFAATSFLERAEPTDAEVNAFLATEEGKAAVAKEYADKSFRFKQPKRVSAQHILVKVEEDAAEADVAAAREKLEEARKQIEGGADFGALAREISEDPGSKEKGGDLGFFGPGTMARPFEEAAMALEPGQISDVVRTRFGFHVIKVNEVQPASEKSLEEVQPLLAQELVRKQKAKELARATAEQVLADVRGGKTLAALFPAPAHDGHGHGPAGGAKDGVAEETGLFNVQSEFVPKVGASADLVAAARAAEKGQALPRVFEVNDAFVVAEVTDRSRPDMDAFEARADEYREMVEAQKQNALLQDFTRKLVESARVEKHPAVFAPAQG